MRIGTIRTTPTVYIYDFIPVLYNIVAPLPVVRARPFPFGQGQALVQCRRLALALVGSLHRNLVSEFPPMRVTILRAQYEFEKSAPKNCLVSLTVPTVQKLARSVSTLAWRA